MAPNRPIEPIQSLAPAVLSDDSKPRLPRGVRLKFDEQSGEWLLLAPERIIKTSATAVAILSRCTGDRSLKEIVDDLAESYAAPRDAIAADARKLIGDLAARRLLDF